MTDNSNPFEQMMRQAQEMAKKLRAKAERINAAARHLDRRKRRLAAVKGRVRANTANDGGTATFHELQRIEAQRKELAQVREFLSHVPEIAKRLNAAKRSPLSAAAAGGSVEVVTTLLGAGADPNLIERRFACGGALFTASSLGHKDIVQLLLERGADPNGPCESSGTSADHAASDEIYQLLMKHGSVGRWEASAPCSEIQRRWYTTSFTLG